MSTTDVGDELMRLERAGLIEAAPSPAGRAMGPGLPPLSAYDLRDEGHGQPSGPVETGKREHSAQAMSSWPAPDQAVFYGLAGDIVKKIEPHTEADPLALLIQILAAYGNVIGRGAYFEVEADRHHGNLFAVLVGETAKGRKGTSWGHAKGLFKTIAPDWATERIQTGLSSGEGLLWAVRDNAEEEQGVDDKRLLILEPEFASTLKVASREGNTLSAIIRQAWDGGTLRTLTKNNPLKADNAHIALIAHVTKEELLRYLNSTESGNGFANRFLWACVKRSKCLPRGGQIHKVDFAPILKKLFKAIAFGKAAGRIEPSEEAWQIWEQVYPELSEGLPGLLGAVTSRAEAQTMRLAMLYALMDCSHNIEPRHLMAGLALWEYCLASAQYIFGNNLGDPIADEILRALNNNPKGMTRTDIYNYFGRHKRRADITRALSCLHGQGLVARSEQETGGRKTEVWLAQKAQKAQKGHGVAI